MTDTRFVELDHVQ